MLNSKWMCCGGYTTTPEYAALMNRIRVLDLVGEGKSLGFGRRSG